MTARRLRHVLITVLAAAVPTLLLAGCSQGPARSSFAGGVGASTSTTAAAPESSSTTAPLSVSSLVLSANGLGPVMFGTQAARALGALTGAMGQAEKPTPVATGSSCGATRMFQWRNLHVLVNEVIGGSGTTAGLVGWSLGAGAPNAFDLKTAAGIGIGSTLEALKAAYGQHFSIVQNGPAPVFNVTTPSGVITGQLDGPGATNRIRSLRAGTFCGE
jgi:hypothetical protein